MENSPLGRLSAELRNQISELVLVRDRDIELMYAAGHNKLSKTCRQMRRETTAIFWNANKFTESNACCYSDFGGIRSYRRSQRIGVLFTMLGKDIVSCFQKLECRLGDRPFQIYGIETGRAKIAEAKRAGKTDACDANLGLQRLCIQPILEVLHDIGLELEAVPGDGMGPWHFVMIENPATSGKTPVCTNVTTRSL